MKYRCDLRLIATILALFLASAAPASGEPARSARVGLVSLHSPALAGHVERIREDLRQLGYVGAKTIDIDARFTDGNKQRAQEATKSFLDRGVDIIVAWTTPTVQLVKEATQTVPVVMIASDPVAAKLVQSLSRPGGNITGISMSGPDLAGKRLELLREINPGLNTIAFLGYAPSPGAAAFVRETRANADRIGMKLLVRLVERADEIDAALFAAMKRDGAQALIVQPFFTGHAAQIVDLAMKAGLPVMSDYPPFAKAGALASLGVDEIAQVRRTAYFIDRILKGANPADLPVEQPTRFQLVLNLKAAKELGLTVPPTLLARADEVIE
jgi:putative ABC transport system substrate-binding protein